MKYKSGKEFLDDPKKVIAFIGLSGVGKTTSSSYLPDEEWFMYNVDYRIWTHYLDDRLNDFLKEYAMRQPMLRRLLLKDAIIVGHKVQFKNLLATSVFMGMPGNPRLDGSRMADFRARMQLYVQAEIAAMLDIPHFIDRSRTLYGYPHFTVDASGSVCEIIELDDPHDPVLRMLEQYCTVIYIRASDEHKKELIRRAQHDPKPIYYRGDFLDIHMPKLLAKHGARTVTQLDPADVARYLYPRLLDHRIPRYETIASRIGYTLDMSEIMKVRQEKDLLRLIACAIDT